MAARSSRVTVASALVACAGASPLIAAAQEPVRIPPVVVIGTAPLPGLGKPIEQVPSNVQTFGASELDRQRTGGVAEFLNFNANSTSLGSPTGNAYQPDVSFRGFTASALLGTPQGLSVFQDGVRINEAFADVVNWDLIPKNAVASMQLLPGSNPIFGLNTLGGALTIQMKDGFRYSGLGASVSAGSFGRVEVSADGGYNDGGLAAFAAFESIDDDGWREHSSTRIRRLYTRIDGRTEQDQANLAVSLADNNLEGTQALPISMLGNPRQAYTWPDNTENRLVFVNGNAQHAFDGDTLLEANAYYRRIRTSGVNSNVNDNYAPPDDPFEAANVDTTGTTQSWGASLQGTVRREWWGAQHQVIAGFAYDAGSTDFDQSSQPAMFTDAREAVGVGPFSLDTAVKTTNRYAGAYVTDTIALTRAWTLALSGRYNWARIATRDETGESPAINGTSTYRRFNPAAGATWTSAGGTNVFGGVSQGMRVPSPVELTCADPNAPCTLPNIFVADPPLAPVKATTYELGVRGRPISGTFYSAALYRTDLTDDIQFVSAGSGAVNAGYFRNVGDTRRQGIELTGGAAVGPFRFVARYSHLLATFETGFVENSPNNTTADADGNIVVVPGNRLPGLPADTFRLRADWSQGPFAVGVSVVAAGRQYARGNENNADPGGKVPGYALMALDASWQLARDWQLFARVDNLLNTRSQNFGILGSNFFRGPGNTFDASLAGPEPFQSPMPAFGIWVGIQYRLDRGGGNR
jgi:outer membrane receptor protein involved in Fe transport